MSLTADDLAGGFYRTKDLMAMKIISSRSDLKDKQDVAGFPRPLKPGRKVALFPKAEVHRWLQKLAAERDERNEKIQAAKIPVAETETKPAQAEAKDPVVRRKFRRVTKRAKQTRGGVS